MKIAVYLGSATECRPIFNETAYEVGRRLSEAGHTIVYGGADIGTMKCLADGAQSVGGEMIGVFPKGFKGTREVWHSGIDLERKGLKEFILVENFAERKKTMGELSDCCLALPGSYGTLDELFTFACERCISVHEKHSYVLNVEGFFDPLKSMLDNIEKGGFLKPSATGIVTFCESIDELLEKIK